MKSIIINGKRPLVGEIAVGGSKNAALPIIFATLITRGISVISSLPDIGDVRVALSLIESFGAKVTRSGSTVYINTKELKYSKPSEELVRSIRASTYLIGACLSRFGECDIGNFGGCNFQDRPIDIHLAVCRALGARVSCDRVVSDTLLGNVINLRLPSVGATVNALILASAAKGKSVIRGFAREPHVLCLVDFLSSAGAEISLLDDEIVIEGRELHGGKVSIIGDMIEAGSYLAAALVTDGSICVRGIQPSTMEKTVFYLSLLGADITRTENSISAKRGGELHAARVIAEPYPGFPTDLQPIFAPIMATHSGGVIVDTVWSSRFGYLDSLSSFGVRSHRISSGAVIERSTLRNARTSSPDLRGGMAAVLAALAARGESVIDSAETVLRGYEALESKLSSLGADIRIVTQ